MRDKCKYKLIRTVPDWLYFKCQHDNHSVYIVSRTWWSKLIAGDPNIWEVIW